MVRKLAPIPPKRPLSRSEKSQSMNIMGREWRDTMHQLGLQAASTARSLTMSETLRPTGQYAVNYTILSCWELPIASKPTDRAATMPLFLTERGGLWGFRVMSSGRTMCTVWDPSDMTTEQLSIILMRLRALEKLAKKPRRKQTK